MSGGRVMRARRGVTLTEVLVTAALTLLLIFTMAGANRLPTLMWQTNAAGFGAQTAGQAALHRMASSIRAARRVEVASSTSTKLTLRLPAYDGSGNLVLPLQDGQLITFYLSNSTGSAGATGNILWRSVNGVPDSSWSLVGGRGRTTVASGGLQFSYYPTTNPQSVTVTLTASSSVGSGTSQFPTSQEFMLRNFGL